MSSSDVEQPERRTPFTFDDATMQDPHPVYRSMRVDEPVLRAVMPSGMKVWLITQYNDVRAALADSRLSKDVDKAKAVLARQGLDATGDTDHAQVAIKHMLNCDPPDHTRLRRLMNQAFTPARVERLRPRVERIAEELLDGFASEPRVDLIERFGFPLPLTVICELLGVPPADRLDIHRWSTAMVSDSASIALTTQAQDDRVGAARQAAGELAAYLAELVTAKRAEPADDLLSALIQAHDNDETLDTGELVSMANLILVAGHETVTNLIGNGVYTLLRHPEQFAALREDQSLVPRAVDELLRYEGPANSALIRHTIEPVRYGDVTIPAGEFVLCLITSANRDDDRFDRADLFDITRPPGGLLTFGHGIHYCIGAPLARLEGEIAIGRLMRRFPRLRFAVRPEELVWRFSTLVRGLDALPVLLS